jgi:hypothetical protein
MTRPIPQRARSAGIAPSVQALIYDLNRARRRRTIPLARSRRSRPPRSGGVADRKYQFAVNPPNAPSCSASCARVV